MSRYARRLWEAPDSSRYLVATQPGLDTLTYGIPVPDPVEGDVCEVTSGSYSCVGNNHHKMQAIFESEALDRVFVAGFAGTETLGILYAIPRTGPLRIVDELRMDLNYGEGYFDPTTGEIGLFEDGVRKFMRIRAADLSPVSVSEVSFCPGETHYDPERNEGIICFDAGPLMPLVRGAYSPYLSLAFRSNPFSYRPLGGGLAGAWAYGALAWGCDFDPVQRRAWILIANLGLVAEVDYDTGKLTRLRRVEPGLRTAVFDPQRRLLYMGNFLKGDVIAWDVDKGQEVHRWFAGRFLRYVGLSRDRNQLLVASNLGVVRIDISAGSPSRGS